MAIPVWTSTKNIEDKESEDAFIEGNSELTRISNEALNGLDPSKLNLKKSFGAHVQVQLTKDWIEKLVPKALDWSQASLDLSLRHIQLALTGTTLSVSSVSRDRIITLKTDVEMTDSGQSEELRDFAICISTEQMTAVVKFLEKGFGFGNCDVGVKINDSGACDYLLLCCYGLAPAMEHSDTLPMKRDEEGNPITEAPQSLKAALFKVQRSIGSLPIPTQYPNWEIKYKAALKPALRWVFSNKQEYVELIANGGVLRAKFHDEADRVVEANLGSQVVCNIPLPEDDTPIAYIKGAYFRDIFSYIKSPVSLTFGFDKVNDKYSPTPIYIESNEICATIAQVYPEEALGKVEAYITHKKGKVVDTEKEEAEKRAAKQNKGAEAIIEFDEAPAPASTPKVEVTAPITPEPQTIVEQETAPETSVDELVIPEVSIDSESTEELIKSISMSQEQLQQASDLDSTPEHILAAVTNIISGLSMLVKQQKNTLRDTMSMLSQITRVFGTDEEKVAVKKEVDAQKDPETKQYVYDIDAIANYFMERSGKEVHITAVRDTLPHLKMSTVNTTILKLVDETVIERVKKGIYRAPVDVAARYEVFRAKYPARRKKL